MLTGIFPDMIYEKYHSIQGLNQTIAKSYLSEQKKSYQANALALTIGNAGHCLLLEPDRFFKDYIKAPEGLNQRGKGGKERWAKFEAEHNGKIVLKANVWDGLMNVRQAVQIHPAYQRFLSEGEPELSIFWHDPRTKIYCKGRLDWISNQKNIIVDLKFTNDIGINRCEKVIEHMAYDFQAAWYMRGMKQLTGKDYQFILIFIQKYKPYGIRIYEMDEMIIEKGYNKTDQVLNAFHSNLKRDNPIIT